MRKEYYQEHREEILEKVRIYRESNKEVIAYRNRRYRQENFEQISAKQRIHYENNKEQILEVNRLYRENNVEKIHKQKESTRQRECDRNRKWREENREEYLEQNRKNAQRYRKANKDLVIAKVKIRELLKLQRMPNWANKDEIIKIYQDKPQGHHVDHIVPLKGKNVCGLHVEYNLQYLTSEENLQKANKFPYGDFR